MNNNKWDDALRQIIQNYKNGSGDEPLDGDSAEALGRTLLAKINLMEGNITEEEFFEMDLSRTAIETERILKESEEGFFKVTSVHKDDLRAEFDGDKKALKRIEAMTDQEMERLASKLAGDYCEQLFWISLRVLFEGLFLEEQK